MDLVNAMVGLQASGTMSRVQMAVAKKVMESQEMQGAAALELLQAASAQVDQAGQAAVAAATGLGREIDVYA